MKKYFSRMFRNIKYANRSTVIGMIIGLLLGVTGTVSAAILISSDEVSYSGKDTSAANVKDALDELYNYSYNGGSISGVEGLSWEFEEPGVQSFTVPLDGMYTVQLWGAQGGGTDQYPGGKGAYTGGDIYLEKGEKLYVYVGGQGTKPTGGYNGGGNGYGNGYGGGGATDIRTVKGEWNNAESLASRIMVAAGGSGSSLYDTNKWLVTGAPGGGLTGYLSTGGTDSVTYKGTIPTQTIGGKTNPSYGGENGKFGIAGRSCTSNWSSGGGGGGWYGGGGGAYAGGLNSSGSSYISGHDGCIAVDVSGSPSGTSISHTKKYFINTKMVDGKGFEWTNIVSKEANGMPTYESTDVMSGNSGYGYAKITLKKMKRDEKYNSNYNNIQSKWTFYYSDVMQTFEVNVSGTYKIELWGASGGGNNDYSGGKGSYTSGEIYLTKGEKYYIYTGASGNNVYKGYNGGGTPYDASFYGGGATDIRTVGDVWNNINSLRSRIMVAAGGSGASIFGNTWNAYGAAGGGLTGYLASGGSDATVYTGTYPTQVIGGLGNNSYSGGSGSFGVAGNGYTNWSTGGGGNGWYGGAGTSYAGGLNSSGSSYISGHDGCIAVDAGGNPTGNSFSFTGKYFINTIMIDGKGYKWTTVAAKTASGMPIFDGSDVMDGNTADGFAKITRISDVEIDSYYKNIEEKQEKWIFYPSATVQPFEASKTGKYKVELWGASGGGSNTYAGGKGAYVSGEIKLSKGEKLYLYTGISGQKSTKAIAYNGGGAPYSTSSYYGGGATDIRTIGNAWNNVESLRSRIMVAAGGSGASVYDTGTWWANGADAGGLTSYLGTGGTDAVKYSGTIATQKSGGVGNTNYPGGSGVFGIGGNGYANWSTAGGGSGWYGGAGSSYAGGLNSSGSSYISGHLGCIGVNQDGTVAANANSYTGKTFTNTKMIDGKGYEWTTKVGTVLEGSPTYDLRDTEIGHSGDGFARITFIE